MSFLLLWVIFLCATNYNYTHGTNCVSVGWGKADWRQTLSNRLGRKRMCVPMSRWSYYVVADQQFSFSFFFFFSRFLREGGEVWMTINSSFFPLFPPPHFL